MEWHDDGWGGHTAVWVRQGVGTGTGLEDVLWSPVECAVCLCLRDEDEGYA